jgi:hypothetical protein
VLYIKHRYVHQCSYFPLSAVKDIRYETVEFGIEIVKVKLNYFSSLNHSCCEGTCCGIWSLNTD